MRHKRLSAVLVTLISVASMIVAGVVTAPSAPALVSGTLPGNTAPTWQTDGTVWAIAAATDGSKRVYVGGQFSNVRPGSGTTGAATPKSYLAAFTGSGTALDPNFPDTVDAAVYALALSPDGSTLYVGGDFTSVTTPGGPVARNRVAAFNTADGTLTGWAPSVNARVRTIAVSSDSVYLGGEFTAVTPAGHPTVTVQHLAKLAASDGQPDAGFTGTADGYVNSLALSTDAAKLLVAGSFIALDGDTSVYSAGMLDAATGAVQHTDASTVIPAASPGCTSVSKVVRADATTAYFGNEGTGSGCFDGTFALNLSDGTVKWVSRCLGATQAVQPLDGLLYTGSHTHDCTLDRLAGDPNAFTELGSSKGLSRHLLSRDLATGRMGTWFPNTDGGPTTTGGLGPRVMATDGTQLFVGGEFTMVNGAAQQGFTRFDPATGDRTAPGRPASPTAVARSGRLVAVYVQAPLDPDDVDLVVRLYRDGGSRPIATKAVHSLLQQQPVIGFADRYLVRGSKHTYQVDVTQADGKNASPRSAASNQVTVVGLAPSYENAVRADSPFLFWRLADSHGPAIADSSSYYAGGKMWGTPAYRYSGATSGNTAISFNGIDSSISSRLYSAPSSYSVSIWFHSITSRGGKLIGFGNVDEGWTSTGAPKVSSKYDKQVYLTNTGRIVFGVYSGGYRTVVSPRRYNDGHWHQIVATQGSGGMTLYVDGARVGSNHVTTSETFPGYWRVGGDNLAGWPYRPSNNYIRAVVDEAAVFRHALSATRVRAQYVASGRH